MSKVAKLESKAVRRVNISRVVADAKKRLSQARDPAEALEVERSLDSIEVHMQNSGLYTPEQIREVNEFRMRARWRLGALLAKMERQAGPGRGKKNRQAADSFTAYLKDTLELEWKRAQEAQRISTLPKSELEKVLAKNREWGDLTSYAGLIVAARPYWYKASRQRRHRQINEVAATAVVEMPLGPFPLIYADPPWKFSVYSEKGLERTADQHYETLTDEEIMGFAIDGKTIKEIAHRDAALLMWCTSSNIHRALKVVEAWGFEFKTSAAWDKVVTGLGLVFRNQHEPLLYATRGNMPGPQHQPSSIFRYPRGAHSAKPPEVRAEIEKMYPDFDAKTRLEIFANDLTIEGWTCYGKPHRQATKSDQAAE